ncbi:hypothetical protein N473_12590 [Pseudoalteromonas luteoviolacea CPMOR-1]|uniref:Uncharacterized protein n=1 Tax=Pseudoalteromonas luteoviolacea CPMOR-1 TaxID=1365248 RepID=A0A167LYU0_9GAMM|nr:hypothetical protein N473_12590 [Pseudoalteromonas luteoviolacea CPMOR-1]
MKSAIQPIAIVINKNNRQLYKTGGLCHPYKARNLRKVDFFRYSQFVKLKKNTDEENYVVFRLPTMELISLEGKIF